MTGGMRLEATNLAGVSPDIPVIPHHDCSDDEVAFLAEYDNENDEYHTPVSPVDIWAEYARLKSLGWTQQRIADAKNVVRSWVSERLKFHSLSNKVKDFVSKGLLPELILQEICRLSVTDTFSPWLTPDSTLVIDRRLHLSALQDMVSVIICQRNSQFERQFPLTVVSKHLTRTGDEEYRETQ
ncbi:MAG: hypothetical protein JRI84_14380 [Deltaproteobacteria bacterium]|nr:hypothetical protein [Deltaproteobacteria bacterium]